MPAPVVFGCSGPELEPGERAFFADADPWGFILFGRNLSTPERVRTLVAALRETVGRTAPVFIDQEGGRVLRLQGPHWRTWPAVGAVAGSGRPEAEILETLELQYRLMADQMLALGIDVNCAPVLDLRLPGADPIIGDRALGAEPDAVAARGRALCRGLLAGGVRPVIKHIPGHGRAASDSHLTLPTVDTPRSVLAETDFAPFRALADMPMAMTAHIDYADIDAGVPATVSARVIGDVIRGEIGFGGVLVSDDLGMQALEGSCTQRAAAAQGAGCDILLHCSAVRAEMEAVMAGIAALEGEAARRVDAAERARPVPVEWDREAGAQRFQELCGEDAT